MLKIGNTKGLYGRWAEQDAITYLSELINKNFLTVDAATGKIYPTLRVDINSPWYFIKPPTIDCFRHHKILFDACKILPTRCAECWKVVVAPRTLRDMWKWREKMIEMDLDSKLGIETRDYVGRLYGSYFYNHGKEAGGECLKKVLAAVEESGIEVVPMHGQKAILKRGCTEIERLFGASDEWEKHLDPESRKIEETINNWLLTPEAMPRCEPLQLRTYRIWVEWAYKNQDPTYADFLTDTGEEFDLLTPYVIYNDEFIGDKAE